MIQFWWRSGSHCRSGSPKSEIRILRIGGGLCSLSIDFLLLLLLLLQLFYSSMDFVRDNPGEPVLEETFTHSHLSRSSIAPYLLHPSNMIHGILPVQSMHLTVFFHNLSPSFLWSTSWSWPDTFHFILHTSPNHCLPN